MSGYYPHAFKWSDEAIAVAKKLAGERYSGSQIAAAINAQFGSRLTRNAVIGKLFREGTSVRGQPAPSSAGTVRSARRPVSIAASAERAIIDLAEQDTPRRQIARIAGVSYRTVRAVLGEMTEEETTARRARPKVAEANKARVQWFDPSEPREIKTGAVEASRPVTLLDAKDGDCRWPLGDQKTPDFRFCGADKVPGHPYCLAHCRAAYTPPSARVVNAPLPVTRTDKTFARFA